MIKLADVRSKGSALSIGSVLLRHVKSCINSFDV